MGGGTSWRLAFCGLACLSSAAGCSLSQFACSDDEACPDGYCVAPGYCAFDDPQCSSGQRYGQHAGDGLAGQCVPSDDTDTLAGLTDGTTGMSTTPTSDSPEGSSTTNGPDPSTTASTTASTTDDSSGTSDGPSSCGDRTLDPGEHCDDGNQVDGDGCNADCTIPGQPIWTVVFDGGAAGTDGGRDIVWIGDRVAVAGRLVIGGDGQLDVRSYEADGNDVWDVQIAEDGTQEGAWGIDVAGNTLAVAGAGSRGADAAGYVAALDLDGAVLWSSSSQDFTAFDVAIDETSNVYLTGHNTVGARVNRWFDGSWQELIAPGQLPPLPAIAHDTVLHQGAAIVVGFDDASPPLPFVRAIDLDTETLAWSADLTDAPVDAGAAYGIAVSAEGTVAVCGVHLLDDAEAGWVAVLSPDGSELLWGDTLDSPAENATVFKVAFAPNGSLIGVGWQGFESDRERHWIGKWDPTGTLQWTHTTDGAAGAFSRLFGVAVSDDNAIAVTGQLANEGTAADYYVARIAP